jgi:Spy/CpxP family protein refolding chaperone
MKKAVITLAACLLAATMWAQDNSQQQAPPDRRDHPPMRRMMGPGGEGAFHLPPGAWWKNSEIVQKINLSDSQVQQIESIFQQSRAALETNGRALRQAEEALTPMVDAETINDAQIEAQLDTIAQARMNLEKAHAQMLLAIRKVLTHDQWMTLQSLGPSGKMRMRRYGEGQQPPPPPPSEFF